MKWFGWWKKTEEDQELIDLEMRLQETLVPVAPRAEFVEGLRRNLLIQFSGIELLAPADQNNNLQTGLLITGGILGGIFVVLAGVRGIVSLIGIVGLLISLLKQETQQPVSTSELAH
jgi:hypothetical protein